MRIVIDYDSCWQTGFLGDDIKKPISKRRKGTNLHDSEGYVQKFVATSKARGEKDTPISESTVLGILCRLIGDQRKLYQAKQSNNFYFSDIEDKISWKLEKESTVSELMYLTNMSDARCGQGTWLGVLSDDNPWFFSEVSLQLWSVLYLNRESLLNFIMGDTANKPMEGMNKRNCYPTELLARLDLITNTNVDEGSPWKSAEKLISDRKKLIDKLESIEQKKAEYIAKFETKPPKTEKQKTTFQRKITDFNERVEYLNKAVLLLGNEKEIFEVEERLNKVVKYLEKTFPKNEYWGNGVMYPSQLYAAALYLQAERMIKTGYNLEFVKNKKREIQIQGFSKRGFNGVRDWLNLMSGGRKKAVGGPCKVNKQSGQLDIHLDIDLEKSIELKNLIDSAGVSSFYLGKKGLAYVSDIDVR